MQWTTLGGAALLALSLSIPAAAKPGQSGNDDAQAGRQGPVSAQPAQMPAANQPDQPVADERGAPRNGALRPPPADAFDKTYVICTKEIRDNCVNRYSARKQGAEGGEQGQ